MILSSSTAAVWSEFETLVGQANSDNPWRGRRFNPDYALLESLLAVPVQRGLVARSGLPAKAVDVWIASELRRAGFDRDSVWPRASEPRVVPQEVNRLLASLPRSDAERIEQRLIKNPARVVSADARVLGRAYYKQVDVVMAHWATGPELLVSTKRMDSSVSNNALNRIEESYGDSHNLRGRHPLAAIGYVLLTTRRALDQAGTSAPRLLDLVERLASEPDGYDASAVLVADWPSVPESGDVQVSVARDSTSALSIARFFETIIACVLDRTPIEDHNEARRLRAAGRDLPRSLG